MTYRVKVPPFSLLFLWLLMVTGCAYPISQSLRQEAAPNVTFPMVLSDPTAYVGTIVIWGGSIIQTINNPGQTELVILQIPLDRSGMPGNASNSQGRFIARISKFLDPAIYKEGRRITLAGEVVDKEVRPLSNIQYTYPVMGIREIYLWPEEIMAYRPPPYYYPYWDPFWGWYMY